MKLDSLIFDIDGTLWDSSETIAEAFSEASSLFPFGKREFSGERLRAEMGRPLNVIFRHLYPELDELFEKDIEQAEKLLRRINSVSSEMEYEFLRKRGGKLYPGVRETLDSLSRRIPLFIVSNCEKGYIEIMLEATGMEPYFREWLCYGDNNAEKDKNIRFIADKNGLKTPAYVGDIDKDAVSSEKAGVPFIWASYGFGSVSQEMYRERIDDFRELEGIIKG